MPHQPRLDAPDTPHQVRVRGLERRALFRDDADRADFVARIADRAEQGAWTVVAWALLPTHAHLLVWTGTRPLPRSMRSLLTGYAGAFNRRYQRSGHLFQKGMGFSYAPLVPRGGPNDQERRAAARMRVGGAALSVLFAIDDVRPLGYAAAKKLFADSPVIQEVLRGNRNPPPHGYDHG